MGRFRNIVRNRIEKFLIAFGSEMSGPKITFGKSELCSIRLETDPCAALPDIITDFELVLHINNNDTCNL